MVHLLSRVLELLRLHILQMLVMSHLLRCPTLLLLLCLLLLLSSEVDMLSLMIRQ